MRIRALLLGIGLVMAHPQHGHAEPKHGEHDQHGLHGNPEDLTGYIAKLEDPARDVWQKPDEVMRLIALSPGQTACDIGTGPGYFALRMAKIVGEHGQVFGVDVEARILEVLRDRVGASALRNVTPVLALPGDPLLPPASCDVILIVNTFHHFPDGVAYLRRAARALKPGGRLINIDFQKRETPVGPPVAHRIAREEFLARAGEAGLTVVAEPTLLPYQYFMVMKTK